MGTATEPAGEFSLEPDGWAAGWLLDGAVETDRLGRAVGPALPVETFGPVLSDLPAALNNAMAAVAEAVIALGAALGHTGEGVQKAHRSIIEVDDAVAGSFNALRGLG